MINNLKIFRGDIRNVKIPLPMKYSFINFNSIVLCRDTSIKPHIIQKGISAKRPIIE